MNADTQPDLALKNGVKGRAPALGPLLGWTRSEDDVVARVWILPDQTNSDQPVAALTARFDGEAMVPGTAQFWRLAHIWSAEPQEDEAKGSGPLRSARQCGLVELSFPAVDTKYRVIGLHFHRGKVFDLPEVLDQPGYATARHGRQQVGFPKPDLPRLWRGPTRLELVRARRGRGLAGPALIEPVRLSLEDLGQIAQAGGWTDAVEKFIEDLARCAFAHVSESYAIARVEIAAPIRPRMSREARRVRNPASCDVQLARAAFDQASADAPACFAAACCRYLGLSFDRERADRSLAALDEAARGERGEPSPGFALLVGDQIYADAFNGVFETLDREEKFTSCYERAFGTDSFRALARRLPLYMAPDDHEIVDGWPKARSVRTREASREELGKSPLFELAWRTYVAHQRAAAPPQRYGSDTDRALAPLWYQLNVGPVAWFVADTRFERLLARDEVASGIMGPAQRDALFDFLDRRAKQQEAAGFAPTFIVSGSVFAPGQRDFAGECCVGRRSDSWQRFPADRAELAAHIARLRLENVVFLSGDYHCAAIAALSFEPTRDLHAYAVVVPPLYAPLPFVNTRPIEICEEETIATPAGGAVAYCTGSGIDFAGYALISVERRVANEPPSARDWSVLVDYRSGGDNEDGARARLGNGRADWLGPPAVVS